MSKVDIYVFYGDVRVLKDNALFQHYESKMAFSRRMKIQKLKTPEGKCLSLGAGILLSRILQEIGVDPMMDPVFGEQGKPYFAAIPDLDFNLSHSGTKVMACFVQKKGVKVGCDVEKKERKLEWIDDIAKRFYSLSEQKQLQGVKEQAEDKQAEEKKNRFYRIWTLKESVVKAQGCGITRALDSFSIVLLEEKKKNPDPQVVWENKVDHSMFKRYFLKEFQLSANECWSLCVETDPKVLLEPELTYHIHEVRFSEGLQ